MESQSSICFCGWIRLLLAFSVLRLVYGDQQGFLSLSCGGNVSFVDVLNINWIPDSDYVNTGNVTTVKYIEGGFTSQVPIRFFPESQGRQCYSLPVQTMSLVLIRSQFIYKNYDDMDMPPSFWISIGTAAAANINLTSSDPWEEEFIWPVKKEIISFCLHSISRSGYPVISRLEVRPISVEAYKRSTWDFSNKSLRKRFRINCGCSDRVSRYPMDSYDRIWDVDKNFSPLQLTYEYSSQLPFNFSNIPENPPIVVLQSARVLARNNIMSYNFQFDKAGDYYVLLYFAGILPVSSTFDIMANGDVIESNYTVKSSEVDILSFMQNSITRLNISLQSVSFYPQINAVEIYESIDIPLECSTTTVSALEVIQQYAGVDFGWKDDPCFPTWWNHVLCEGSVVTSLVLSDVNLRTISPTFGDLLDLKTLDLHNTSLNGQIQNLASLQQLETLNLSFNELTSFGFDLSFLVSLQILDLHNNSFAGPVPDILGSLKNLHLLNLENNKLLGILPESLQKGSLVLRCTHLSENPSTQTPLVTVVHAKYGRRHGLKAAIFLSLGGAFFAVMVIVLAVFVYRWTSEVEVASTSRELREIRNWNDTKIFSYKEIKVATNKFKNVIGRGRFASVYLGQLPDGKLVAVKVLYDQTQLAADSFINEVYLLSQIRHQNLVPLEGFCNESKQQILVYEYLPGGSLSDNLYGLNSKKVTLNWARRLKIAVDVAKGLDYLHSNSDPRIIHHDVKCSNILLDMGMNAKVCDFGISKQVHKTEVTNVTTVIKGTAGYLDPEYFSTQQLTEKSDVYSFGVVLLELICGREPLNHSGSPDSYNLVLWAKPYLQAGTFEVVDKNLEAFAVESMRKVGSVASKCVERDASQRPTMGEVLLELKEAYSIELEYLAAQAGH